MKRALLAGLALAGLPLAWGLGDAFWRGLVAGSVSGALVTPGRVWFFGGALAMTLLYFWKGQSRGMQLVYVFGHEMTHALFCLLSRARIYRIRISSREGFVEHSGHNIAITLSPYCFPLYLLAASGICALTQWLAPGYVPEALWAGVFGALLFFHILSTLDALLSVAQPDVAAYGRFFSYWLILCLNLLFGSGVLICAGHVGWRQQAHFVANASCDAYVKTSQWIVSGAHSLLAPLKEGERRR